MSFTLLYRWFLIREKNWKNVTFGYSTITKGGGALQKVMKFNIFYSLVFALERRLIYSHTYTHLGLLLRNRFKGTENGEH